MGTRDPYFDIVRAFAMACVVMSHVWQCSGHLTREQSSILTNFFIGLDMPLFFVIAGVFANGLLKSGEVHRLIRRVRDYLLPAFEISILFAVIGMMLPSGSCNVSQIFLQVARWAWGRWFVVVLSYCYMVMFVYFAIKSSLWKIVYGVSVVVVILCAPNAFHFHELKYMLPHFCIGIFVFSRIKVWERNFFGFLSTLIFFAFICLEGNVMTNGMGFYWSRLTIVTILRDGIPLVFFTLQILTSFFGCVSVMWVLRKLFNAFPKLDCLAVYGTTTLGVYLLHQQILLYIGNFGVYPLSVPLCFVVSIFLFLFCHFCVMFKRKAERVISNVRGDYA